MVLGPGSDCRQCSARGSLYETPTGFLRCRNCKAIYDRAGALQNVGGLR